MVFVKKLIVGESLKNKKQKIMWKIRHNSGMFDVFVITLSSNKDNLLDIINSSVLMQKYYPKDNMIIVGIAKGYDEAVDIVGRIVEKVYKETGSFNVRDYVERVNNIRS